MFYLINYLMIEKPSVILLQLISGVFYHKINEFSIKDSETIFCFQSKSEAILKF